MTTDQMGQLFALLAALTWGLSLSFFRRSGESVNPLALNLFKNTVAIIFFVLALIFLNTMQPGVHPLDLTYHFRGQPVENLMILVVSGIVGIAIADTLLFYSLNAVGVSLFVIVECAYSPVTLLFAYWLLSEELQAAHLFGGALIMVGIAITAGEGRTPDRSMRDILIGLSYGFLYIAFMAVGIVYCKPVFQIDGFPLLEATTIRLMAGTVALFFMMLASPRRKNLIKVFRPTKTWWLTIPGSFLGGTLAMWFWIAGFKYTETGVAAILNQTSVIFAIIFAYFLLGERMTYRRWAAVVLAMSGVLIMSTLSGKKLPAKPTTDKQVAAIIRTSSSRPGSERYCLSGRPGDCVAATRLDASQ